MAESTPELALAGIRDELARRGRRFALVGGLAVAGAEELLAMKILSMTATRLQDRIDAQRLLQFTPVLDLERVREHLARISERGYARDQDLTAKLAVLLRDTGREE
jgi:beta-glucosidase-like glycosyl hydrolase